MSPRLKVFSLLIERLKKLPEHSSGQLFGICNDQVNFVLGIRVTNVGKNEGEKEKDSGDLDSINNYDLVANLPADISMCGIYQISNDEGVSENFTNTMVDKDVPMIMTINYISKDFTIQLYEDEGEKFKKVEFDIVNEKDVLNMFVHFRLTATIPLSCDSEYGHVQEFFNNLQEKINAGNAAFQINSSDIYILGDSPENISGIPHDSSIEKLFSVTSVSSENEKEIPIFNVNLFLNSSNNDTSPQPAPVIKYVKKIFKHISIQVPLDAFSMVYRHLKIKDLYPILVESVYRNLAIIEKCILSQLASGDVSNLSLPQTYHFLPSVCGHFVSITYPLKQNLEQQKNFRETFHILLGLPLDKPFFRPGNAYTLSNIKKNDSKLLLNPHEGLGKSGVPDGEPCFVQGVYAYHHYMQDNFDDNGWGCAYRSLQTICSWFKFQGYTNMPVPTHKEIQQCLVNIGDKPSNFVGSHQWIGSTEVGFVLDSLLGVTCRIVRVSSGEELSMKGGELSYHFKTQGTPVMIGGGVLAHTILGVDYNKKTGAIKFLILDPHYTGSEDLNIIQSKGWCGWKGPEFWKKDAFYNMCMPIRPKCV